jgi:NAD(P)-dependent dehydrogenase (short-subunit alcohol dehydrogenase family)
MPEARVAGTRATAAGSRSGFGYHPAGFRCSVQRKNGRVSASAYSTIVGPDSVSLPAPDRPCATDLRDRVVFITGAAGGIGRPLALAAAARGATVVLHGRVTRKLETLYDEIVDAGHTEPVILPLDLAKAEAADFANVANALEQQLGRLDAIVHTAVMLGSLGPIEHQSFDNWLSVLRVDLAAPMGLTRALLPLLSRAADASVTFTLDTRGEEPHAYWGSYAAAKAGLSALARILADEWESRDNLRVNAVVPGPIRSPLRGQTHPAEDLASLPPPEALVPLYLHLVVGQAKADSAQIVDAQAWLVGAPATTSLLP